MGAQLLEERGAEGKIVAAERWSAKGVEGVAKMTRPWGVSQEADEAQGDISEEDERRFQKEREGGEEHDPREEYRSADEDAPEGDDVGPVGEFAFGKIGGEEWGRVEESGGEDQRGQE